MTTQLPIPWLDNKRGYLTDWVTQKWVRITGRRINLQHAEWLRGPIGETKQIGEEYFTNLATRDHLTLSVNPDGAGLIDDFSQLHNHAFWPAEIHPAIKDFYEHTTKYSLDMWSKWCGIFKPFGWLLAVLFSRRLQQLNLPISPLETSTGITSDIIKIQDETDAVVATGWLRKIIATKSVIYAGLYSTCKPPKFPSRCIKVVFPLPNGNATVVMKPEQHADGSISLISSGNGFGEPGFYFIVKEDRDLAWVKYLYSMKESIHVYVDDANELRANHVLKLWGRTFLQLHYRMRLVSRLAEI